MSSLSSSAFRSAPEVGPTCPGCERKIDPLRAGHVAIFDGAFLYYCNADCKAAHLAMVAGEARETLATAAPPPVVETIESVPPISHERPSQKRLPGEPEPESEPDFVFEAVMAEPFEAERARALASVSVPSFPESAGRDEPRVAEVAAEPAPAEPLEAERAEAPVNATKPVAPVARSGLNALSFTAAVAGVLVPLLAVADVALLVRLALAVVGAMAFAARAFVGMRKHAPSQASSLAVTIPVLGATGAAIACAAAGSAQAPAIAVLAGLSTAIAVVVEETMAHAWSEIAAAREAITTALAITGANKDVRAGEDIGVEAGEVVCIDGVVSGGEATVLPWNGAHVEMSKCEGDAIVAGAQVLSGRLRVTTSWVGAERAWVRATSSPAALADVSAQGAKLGRAFAEQAAPIAAVVAGVAAFAGGIASGWGEALAVASAVGVGFAGRGVALAVALVHARAQTKALAHGVVYKNARAFDDAGRAAIAVVCSRGTVLTGEPEIVGVERIVPSSGARRGETPDAPSGREPNETQILSFAAGAHEGSPDPFARAILRAARTRGVVPDSVRSATVHAGLGVTALASSGERLIVGSRGFLLQEKVSVAVAEAHASELEAQGRSVLLVALSGKLIGLVALQDGLRPGARAAVQRLLDARIDPVLLSGESRETCDTIARALDIDHVRPEVLPTDRAAEVRALAEGGQIIAAIGHPESDGGVLDAADIGVAMGAAGQPAGEWGIALASDDVRDAALGLALAHSAREKARATLMIGAAPGVLAAFAIVFGVGSLVLAPLAMAVGALSAIVFARRD